jgi:hypothetical protein
MNDCLMVKTPDGSSAGWHRDNPVGIYYRSRVWSDQQCDLICWVLNAEKYRKLVDENLGAIHDAMRKSGR